MAIKIVEDTDTRLRRVSNLVASSVGEFNKALTEYADTIVPSMHVKLQKAVVLQILRRVVLKTPVDTGRARGNWQVGIGKIPEGQREITGPGQRAPATRGGAGEAGDTALKLGAGELKKLGFGEVVWVANNVDYILFLEDGSSRQAGRGMLRVTLEEVQTIFPDRGSDVT